MRGYFLAHFPFFRGLVRGYFLAHFPFFRGLVRGYFLAHFPFSFKNSQPRLGGVSCDGGSDGYEGIRNEGRDESFFVKYFVYIRRVTD